MASLHSPHNVVSITPVQERGALYWEAAFGDGATVKLTELDLMDLARRKRYAPDPTPEQAAEIIDDLLMHIKQTSTSLELDTDYNVIEQALLYLAKMYERGHPIGMTWARLLRERGLLDIREP